MKKRNATSRDLRPHASALTRGGAAHQIGAICYRTNETGVLEIFLITTRASGRWTRGKRLA